MNATLRADQIGSLAGPPALQLAYAGYLGGRVTADALHLVQDDAIRDVIAKQEALGYPVLSDGEFRRGNFQESFGLAVSGFDVPPGPANYVQDDQSVAPHVRSEQNFEAAGAAIHTRRPVVERLKLVRNVALEEYRFSNAIARTPVKVTLLSADRIAQRFAYEHSRHIYPDIDAFLADVVAIQREMIAGLVAAGCRYIQIDAPGYTAYADEPSLERMRARGEDPEQNLARAIAADNACIAGFPGVLFGIHLCHGNNRTVDPVTGKVAAQWHREGTYDAYAERLFGELRHDRILLEYDSERAGGFEPLRFVPRGKVVVLGLVTTKDEALEPADLLERRIAEASRFVPLEQLALSPQCGFGNLGLPVLDEDDQWAKFRRILEVADRVWGRVR